MTAKIIQMDQDVEAAIRERRLTKIELTKARMNLEDGVLSLRAEDLLPPKVKTAEEIEQVKTNKQRQQEFKARRKEQGYEPGYVHKSIRTLAEEVGGQDKIVDMIAAQRQQAANEIQVLRQHLKEAEERVRTAEAELAKLKTKHPRPWWKLW